MTTLGNMVEHCEVCGAELEIGQIGKCDSCQGLTNLNRERVGRVKPEVGEKWDSASLTQRFNVISGPEAQNGYGEWSDKQFVGHRAKRTTDGKLALVGLTKKPARYPYDFVLL